MRSIRVLQRLLFRYCAGTINQTIQVLPLTPNPKPLVLQGQDPATRRAPEGVYTIGVTTSTLHGYYIIQLEDTAELLFIMKSLPQHISRDFEDG